MIRSSYGEKALPAVMDDHGLSDAFTHNRQRAADGLTAMAHSLPGFARQCGRMDDLPDMETVRDRLAGTFDDILVFGTGGSSLGGQAATALARYGDAGGPRLHFPDSLDPYEMDRLFSSLTPQKTHILAISKSGGTAETLAQLLTARAWIDTGVPLEKIGRHFTFITEPGDRPLRRYGEGLGCMIIDHPSDVGGRFSVLTAVGMVPAMLSGLSVTGFRDGARAVLDDALANPGSAAPVEGAALAYTLAAERNIGTVVLMPYADVLRAFTRWHGQLWAESLGKDGLGSTPVRAIGPVDQHSQLQLYVDGPDDKFYTLIGVPGHGRGPAVPHAPALDNGLDYMAGKTIGDIVACQTRATAETLRKRGRSVRMMTMEAMDERWLGGLFMHFMLETVLTAHLMGINAYDQPGVEDSKVLTRRYLCELE